MNSATSAIIHYIADKMRIGKMKETMKKTLLCIISITSLTTGVAQAGTTVEICRYRYGRQAALSLTFDDGISDHFTMVAPRLDRLGLRATFWVNAANIGSTSPNSHYLTWDQCRKMAASGHEISNHGWSHLKLTNLSPEEIAEEVRKCDDEIERELGTRPKTFCFPYNSHNATVDSICGAGRCGMRTFQEGQGQANNHSTAESLSNWLDGIIEAGEWGVTMSHGIHHGWDQWENENVLWNYFKQICTEQSRLWVDTFAAVSAYIAERDNCTVKVRGGRKSVTLIPSCSLDPAIFTEKLTAKVTVGNDVRYIEFDPFGGPQTFSLEDPLFGKVLNVIGDSYVRNHQEPFSRTWHSKVAASHSMIYNNYGINGSCVAFDRTKEGFGKSLEQRYSDMADADFILVIAGHNDASKVQDEQGHRTFREKLEALCRGLKDKWPEAGIGWVTPWAVNSPGFDTVNADIVEICGKYGIPILNTATDGIIEVENAEFRAQFFQSPADRAHLNDAGHNMMVTPGNKFLESLRK